MALLEELCHLGWAWRSQKAMPGPFSLTACESGCSYQLLLQHHICLLQALPRATMLPIALPSAMLRMG